MTKRPTDYGSVALKVLGRVALDGGSRETLIAKRENGTAHVCALLLQSPTSGHARHAVNLTGTALDRLKYLRRLGDGWDVSQPRYDAGMRFRASFHNGGQQPNVTMRYEPGEAHSAVEMSPSQEIHYEAWRGACRALRRYANPVISCCCFDIDPANGTLPWLLEGLDILAFKVYA